MMHDEKAKSPRVGGMKPLVHNAPGARNLEKQAHKRIGTHLRDMYESVVQQPIPSRFTDLIAQLDDTPAETAIDEA